MFSKKIVSQVNTEICEQLFCKVNSHTNCKSMNEARYFLIWLYNLDLHNFDIEELVSSSDPRTEYRWMKINIKKVDIKEVQKTKVDEEKDTLTDLEKQLRSVTLKETTGFVCKDCGGGFTSQGYLDQHREKKHGEVWKPYKCDECDKILASKRNIEVHVLKIHRSCKVCNMKFESKLETENHKKTHTTCNVCSVDMKNKYRLDRHMKIH